MISANEPRFTIVPGRAVVFYDGDVVWVEGGSDDLTRPSSRDEGSLRLADDYVVAQSTCRPHGTTGPKRYASVYGARTRSYDSPSR